MNINTATVAGLVMVCTTVSHAQHVSTVPSSPVLSAEQERPQTATPEWSSQRIDLQNIPYTPAATNSGIPMGYREIYWTNRADTASAPADPVFSAGSNEYQVIVLSHEGDIPLVNDDEIERTVHQTADQEAYLLGTFTGKELLDWMAGPSHTNIGMKQGETEMKAAQIIVIEPESSEDDRDAERIKIYEQGFVTTHPKATWQEWLKPRMFMMKWADFWMHETNATPVVLVLIKF